MARPHIWHISPLAICPCIVPIIEVQRAIRSFMPRSASCACRRPERSFSGSSERSASASARIALSAASAAASHCVRHCCIICMLCIRSSSGLPFGSCWERAVAQPRSRTMPSVIAAGVMSVVTMVSLRLPGSSVLAARERGPRRAAPAPPVSTGLVHVASPRGRSPVLACRHRPPTPARRRLSQRVSEHLPVSWRHLLSLSRVRASELRQLVEQWDHRAVPFSAGWRGRAGAGARRQVAALATTPSRRALGGRGAPSALVCAASSSCRAS